VLAEGSIGGNSALDTSTSGETGGSAASDLFNRSGHPKDTLNVAAAQARGQGPRVLPHSLADFVDSNCFRRERYYFEVVDQVCACEI
jgi:hypothetical protein